MKKALKKISEKYVTESTFEKHMRSIVKSFEQTNASLGRHEKVMEEILKELKQMHEDNKFFRLGISNLYTDGISYDKRINNLTGRVEKLESK